MMRRRRRALAAMGDLSDVASTLTGGQSDVVLAQLQAFATQAVVERGPVALAQVCGVDVRGEKRRDAHSAGRELFVGHAVDVVATLAIRPVRSEVQHARFVQ